MSTSLKSCKRIKPLSVLEAVVFGGRTFTAVSACTVVFMLTACVQIQVQTFGEKLQTTIDLQRTVALNVANLIFMVSLNST